MPEYQMIKPGDIIISSPYADTGVIFNKSVILIISHNESGTSGVIINKILSQVSHDTIKQALQLNIEESSILNLSISDTLPIYFGGPLAQEKGIILHSNDYQGNSLIKINEDISINNESPIISDIISGVGPIHKMLILGCATWSPNQLFTEIKRNDWILLLNTPKQKNFYDLIFKEEDQTKWNQALKLAGIEISHYSNTTGHA